jgi:hypothetical protein
MIISKLNIYQQNQKTTENAAKKIKPSKLYGCTKAQARLTCFILYSRPSTIFHIYPAILKE